VIINNL